MPSSSGSGGVWDGEWVMPGKKLDDGTHYVLTGPEDGELVVVVHGIGAWWAYLDSCMPFLEAAGFRILRYDLIGRGFSDMPPEGTVFDGDAHVLQLENLIRTLGLNKKRYHIVGHSMGGAVTALYAAKNAAEVKSITVLSPAGLMDVAIVHLMRMFPFVHPVVSKVLNWNQESAWRNDYCDKHTPLVDEAVRKAWVVYRNNPHQHEAFFRCIQAFPLDTIGPQVEEIAAQQTPVLVIWGKEDRVVTYEPSFPRWKRILSTNPHAEFEVYDKTGHAFMAERPDVVWPRVIAFINKASAAST